MFGIHSPADFKIIKEKMFKISPEGTTFNLHMKTSGSFGIDWQPFPEFLDDWNISKINRQFNSYTYS